MNFYMENTLVRREFPKETRSSVLRWGGCHRGAEKLQREKNSAPTSPGAVTPVVSLVS